MVDLSPDRVAVLDFLVAYFELHQSHATARDLADRFGWTWTRVNEELRGLESAGYLRSGWDYSRVDSVLRLANGSRCKARLVLLK